MKNIRKSLDLSPALGMAGSSCISSIATLVAIWLLCAGAAAQEPSKKIDISTINKGFVANWIKIQNVPTLENLGSNAKLEIMQIPIGTDLATVHEKIKKSYPHVKSVPPGSHVFSVKGSSDSYIALNAKFVSLSEGLQSAPYINGIKALIRSSRAEDTLGLGFTSPASGNILIGVTRSTTFSTFNEFPSEQQVIGSFVERFGPASLTFSTGNNGRFMEWLIPHGTARAATTQEVGAAARAQGLSGGGHSGCAVLAGNAVEGDIFEAGRPPANRFDLFRYSCRSYALYLSVTLLPGGQADRFKGVMIQFADLAAARKAFQVDGEFARLARASVQQLPGPTYKP